LRQVLAGHTGAGRLLVCIALVVGSLVAGCATQNRRFIDRLPDVVVYTQPPVKPAPVLPAPPAGGYAVYPDEGWLPPGGIEPRWRCIVIHHSADDSDTPEGIDAFHRQRGWDEMGYHFVIGNGVGFPDGEVYVGPRWTKQKHGAHCKVPGNFYNEHGIGICLIGNFELHHPTDAQMRSLAALCRFLCEECQIPSSQILTHGGITGRTQCPGRYFSLAELHRRLGHVTLATSAR
jgi:N-acetylmuramoyl-L-alanine amidase